jgi:hypothetical protein
MQPTQAVDLNAIMASWVDRGLWHYYDTISIPQAGVGAASYQPFSIPLGQGSPAKTKIQTNMRASNMFPSTVGLILDYLGFYFSPSTILADQILFIENYYFTFRIDNKIFFEGLSWMQPPGYGVSGATAKTNESAWGLGLPDFRSVLRFGDFSKYIAPLMPFSLEFIAPNPPTFTSTANGGFGVTLVPFMHGLTDRSVQ